MQDCPVRKALEMLGGKWTLLILNELREACLRYAELKRRVSGISDKMLSQELRHLEQWGLLVRHDYAEVPPRVDYQLSDKGHSALEVVESLARFGIMMQAQEAEADVSAAAKT
jgi:Predicted transcriptional regulators